MKNQEENAICCICKHNKMVLLSTFCGHKEQKNHKLKNHTRYSDSCLLFEERDAGFYESGTPITTPTKSELERKDDKR